MMKLRYTVSMDDVLALNHYFYRHAFIFVGPAMAHVVPRAAVIEGDFDSFITAAKAHVQAAERRT